MRLHRPMSNGCVREIFHWVVLLEQQLPINERLALRRGTQQDVAAAADALRNRHRFVMVHKWESLELQDQYFLYEFTYDLYRIHQRHKYHTLKKSDSKQRPLICNTTGRERVVNSLN